MTSPSYSLRFLRLKGHETHFNAEAEEHFPKTHLKNSYTKRNLPNEAGTKI